MYLEKRMTNSLSLNIELDYGQADTEDMFQIISIENTITKDDLTKFIDVGVHYHNIKEVLNIIASETNIPLVNIHYEIV